MKAEAQKEHQWLQKMVGEWTYESACPGEPGKEPMKFTGTERVRSMGGLWVVAEGQGAMPDGEMGYMMLTVGYDPKKQKYVGTWVGSMMTNMWVYEGSLDATGNVLTLDTDGPSFTDATKTTKYQDVITLKGDNERTLTSRAMGDDGKWQQFMVATYRRTK